MKRRVVVSANDNCRAKTTQSLSNFGLSCYGGEHRVRELLRMSTVTRRNCLFKYELPILLKAANTRLAGKKIHCKLVETLSHLPAHFVPSAPQEATKILA